jgi:hypothetical protein
LVVLVVVVLVRRGVVVKRQFKSNTDIKTTHLFVFAPHQKPIVSLSCVADKDSLLNSIVARAKDLVNSMASQQKDAKECKKDLLNSPPEFSCEYSLGQAAAYEAEDEKERLDFWQTILEYRTAHAENFGYLAFQTPERQVLGARSAPCAPTKSSNNDVSKKLSFGDDDASSSGVATAEVELQEGDDPTQLYGEERRTTGDSYQTPETKKKSGTHAPPGAPPRKRDPKPDNPMRTRYIDSKHRNLPKFG